jgi:signal transduction histidine kinase
MRMADTSSSTDAGTTLDGAVSGNDLAALYETAVALSSQLDLPPLLEAIVERAVRLVGADTGGLYLISPGASELELSVLYRLPQTFRGMRLKLGEGLAGRAAETGQVQVTADYTTWEGQARQYREQPFHAVLAVPLFEDGRVAGVLDLLYETPGAQFQERDIHLAKLFGAQAAVAVRNARLYASLEQRNMELQQANRVKTEFFGNMNHELRTPMSAIIGYTEMLIDGGYGPMNDQALDSLHRIKRNAVELLGQINTMLDLSQIEADRLLLDPQSFLFHELIATVSEAIQPLAEQKGLTWNVTVDDSVPRIMVGDWVRLRQILVNLLGNAAKFTWTGGLALRCRIEPEAHLPRYHGPAVVYEVADTGIGIAHDQLEIIWDAFRQVDGSESRPYGGTGLGLTIVQRLVALMGGSVTVASELGQGTTFTVMVPLILPPPLPGDE